MFQLEKIGHGPPPFPSQSVNLQMPCVGILGTQPNAQQDARANLRAWGGSKGGERWVRKFGKFRGWTIITSITHCPSSYFILFYFIFRRFNNPFPDHFVFQTWSSAEPPRGVKIANGLPPNPSTQKFQKCSCDGPWFAQPSHKKTG